MPEESQQGGLAPVLESEEFREIGKLVNQLFGLVGGSLTGATEALLSGDHRTARDLISRDEMVDELYRKIQGFAYDVLLDAPREAGAIRYLISILRIIPELERSGDLAEHIARRALHNFTGDLTPRIRGIVAQMGEIGLRMWILTADDFADRQSNRLETIESMDDDLDDLQVALIAELASGSLSVPVTIEMALIARFYERFGDHAVNLARVMRGLWN
ncbi:MAG: hypothetical protein M0Z29_06995 [Actinomycetota bacterium]|nr:hypothetical protein [Actinomycetota bacterium]